MERGTPPLDWSISTSFSKGTMGTTGLLGPPESLTPSTGLPGGGPVMLDLDTVQALCNGSARGGGEGG